MRVSGVSSLSSSLHTFHSIFVYNSPIYSVDMIRIQFYNLTLHELIYRAFAHPFSTQPSQRTKPIQKHSPPQLPAPLHFVEIYLNRIILVPVTNILSIIQTFVMLRSVASKISFSFRSPAVEFISVFNYSSYAL